MNLILGGIMMNYKFMGCVLAILSVVIILNGCSEGGGGGSGVSPVRDEPAILDSVLAVNVFNDRPDGITELFFDDSKEIYLWIYWTNVEGRHEVVVNWYSPDEGEDDPPYWDELQSFNSPSGQQITWFYLNNPSGGFIEGEWFAEIYLDDEFERMHIFTVQ